MKSLFLVIMAILVIAAVDTAPVLEVADPGNTPIEFIETQINLLSQLITAPFVFAANVLAQVFLPC